MNGAGSLPPASVVVATRERADLLRESLARIAEAVAQAPGTEVVIVEQGSSSAAEICTALELPATIVSDDGRGASRARNLGWRRATGDFVLFTDDDCAVPADWIRRHADVLADPSLDGSLGPVIGLGSYDEEHDPVARTERHTRGAPPWVVGHSSNMAIRRSALSSAGGFDERIGPGTRAPAGEDADLIVRLLRGGSILTSGTGQPVRHIAWRSSTGVSANLVSYEHGAGVWIGKALRADPSVAASFLRARFRLISDHARHAKATGDRSIRTRTLVGALARGLLTGVRLGRWRGVRS